MIDPKTAFAVAARHLDDADLLLENGRPDNAGYLAGYVGECCLKALLFHPSLPRPKELGHDLPLQMDVAWQFCAAIAPARRRITMPASPEVRTLLTHWKPDLRYDPAGSLGMPKAQEFVTAAHEIFRATALEQLLDHSQYTA